MCSARSRHWMIWFICCFYVEPFQLRSLYVCCSSIGICIDCEIIPATNWLLLFFRCDTVNLLYACCCNMSLCLKLNSNMLYIPCWNFFEFSFFPRKTILFLGIGNYSMLATWKCQLKEDTIENGISNRK